MWRAAGLLAVLLVSPADETRDGTWDWDVEWATLIALPKVSF